MSSLATIRFRLDITHVVFLSLFVGSQKFDIGEYISTYKLGDFVMMTIH